uniref:Uncharacterized protein n=1 Tax=Thuretia quercifolia TaxID=189650 RepID=A0A1Z1MKD1_9FLOR|nr:hypothetical protein [Thuretia quercifolia]ARW66396.1 hypothetical protein [Thuretia quercifolia]
MKSNFENTNNYETDYNVFSNVNDDNSLEIPIGWSNICFNETISYYNDYHTKANNIDS